MRPIKCMNGHFFDGDKYSTCPECGAGEQGATASVFKPQTDSKKGFKDFIPGFLQKKNNDANIINVSKHEDSTVGLFKKDVPKTDMSTESMIQDKNAPVNIQNYSASVSGNSMVQSVTPSTGSVSNVSVSSVSEVSSTSQSVVSQSMVPGVLSSQIASAKSDNYGKTVGYFSSPNTQTQAQTEDPVVGWIVVIKGLHKGASFSLVAGRNSVGRSETNTVALTRDNQVSREKHAWVIYEPKKRVFYVQPGESNGLTYVNEENIFETKKLSSEEIIEVGSSHLMLVPLCGESFSWDEIDE